LPGFGVHIPERVQRVSLEHAQVPYGFGVVLLGPVLAGKHVPIEFFDEYTKHVISPFAFGVVVMHQRSRQRDSERFPAVKYSSSRQGLTKTSKSGSVTCVGPYLGNI
jgi:hypothetical protein